MSRLLYQQIKDYVPKTFIHQVNSEYYPDILLKSERQIERVMDLGCGPGNSLDYFRMKDPAIKWIGLDIADSPEAKARTRTDGEFYTYDGTHMPFRDNCFDLIYSHQVLEHVRYPTQVLREVYRVLKPNGYFVGSTSQLEPYHTYSLWNYTPYGFLLMIEEVELQLLEIAPSIDALTLIVRQGLGGPKFFSRWWKRESPLNSLINLFGTATKKEPAWINAAKLVFCGQFCFLVRKPDQKTIRIEA